jgi:hypothetical protein
MSSQKRNPDTREPASPFADAADSSANPDSGNNQGMSRSTLNDLQLEVALYIESLSAELRTMARENQLESLAYFLEMARIEASIQVERRALQLGG